MPSLFLQQTLKFKSGISRKHSVKYEPTRYNKNAVESGLPSKCPVYPYTQQPLRLRNTLREHLLLEYIAALG